MRGPNSNLLSLHMRQLARRPGGGTVEAWIISGISKKSEYGSGKIEAGCPSSLGFGVGGQSYSNFLASTVQQRGPLLHLDARGT